MLGGTNSRKKRVTKKKLKKVAKKLAKTPPAGLLRNGGTNPGFSRSGKTSRSENKDRFSQLYNGKEVIPNGGFSFP
jgi:hypothetical protein